MDNGQWTMDNGSLDSYCTYRNELVQPERFFKPVGFKKIPGFKIDISYL
jgi:hypothetical protein